MMVKLVGCLNLPRNFVDPSLRHMAVRARGAHAGAVGIMDRLLVFLIDVVLHFMTCNAEFFVIGQFQRPVETSPEHNSGASFRGYRRRGFL